KNQKVGIRTGDSLGSSNANFGINSGSYQQKEVILTSITGGNVNLYIEGNTNMKGSLIAAGSFSEDGSFTDNGQLNFSTDTLTYSSLSSTMFSNSKSESKGSSYVFANGAGLGDVKTMLVNMDIVGDGETPQYASTVGITERLQNAMTQSSDYTWSDVKGYGKKVEKAEKQFKEDTGMNKDSDIWNYSMGMEYSSEKTLSTIGQGTITIRDKDNSDDINTLNRDINSMNYLLYSGGIGLDVESVSKVGMPADIKNIVDGVYDIPALIDNIDASNIFGITQGVEGALNTINNIGYFIDNLGQLKGIPEAMKSAREENDAEKMKKIFETDNKNKKPIIGIPNELQMINQGYDAITNIDKAIDGAQNIGNGDFGSIMDVYRNLDDAKNDIDNIKKINNTPKENNK
ncbi:MAG: hypothetical protein LBB59_05565, partial [Campylobacteraceae bacterium]|nr:hypothetical protein [Campylobacteraceae bacterium]